MRDIVGRGQKCPYIWYDEPIRVMKDMTGSYCDVSFDVSMRVDIEIAFQTVYDIFEDINITNMKIDTLYKETDTVRSIYRGIKEHDGIYRMFNGKVYDSFVEYAGTWEHVKERLVHYSNELDILYEKPKQKLENHRSEQIAKLYGITENMGWSIEHEFSADPDKKPMITVRS